MSYRLSWLLYFCHLEDDLLYRKWFVTYQKNIRGYFCPLSKNIRGYFCYLSKKYSVIFLLHITRIFVDIFVTYQKNIRGYPPPCNGHTSSSFRRAIYTSPEGPVVNFVRFWNSTNLSFMLVIGCLIVHSPGGLVWNQEICQSSSWKSSPWFKIDAFSQNSCLYFLTVQVLPILTNAVVIITFWISTQQCPPTFPIE